MAKFDNTCDFDKPASSQGKMVDEDEVRQLEQAAIERIRGWTRLDGVENPLIATSFGLESAPLSLLCKKAGIDRALTIWTPCGYPQQKEYGRRVADEFGLDLEEMLLEWWTNEWLYNNREYLFPNAEGVDDLTNMRQLWNLEDYINENDINLVFFGRRLGDNPANATQPLRSRPTMDPEPCYVGHPMWEWRLDHVLSYIEMEGFGLSPVYKMRNANSNANGEGAWHDRQHIARNGTVVEPLDSCWYTVYDIAPEDFWNDILKWFPQGHNMAETYARREELPYDHTPPHPDECPPKPV